MPMRIAALILSCPARAAALQETLAAFAATDWPEPPLIHLDSGEPSLDEEPIARGVRGALEKALALPADHILLLEDDLLFNRHLWHNLTHWPPLSPGSETRLWPGSETPATAPVHLAYLCNPQIRPRTVHAEAHYFIPALNSILGSQARIFSRKLARLVVEKLHGPGLTQDKRIARLAATLGPIAVHTPSLVQHVGKASTWGGPFHQAWDFDPDFR